MNDTKMHSMLKKKEKILMNISFSTKDNNFEDQGIDHELVMNSFNTK